MKKSTFWLIWGLLQVAILVADMIKGDYSFFGFWLDLIAIAICVWLYTVYRKEERVEQARRNEIVIHFNNLAATDPEMAERIAKQHATWDLR